MPAWLVIDLEATTDEGGWPLEEMEIIEIGAVLVTCGGEEISQWQHFVRPIRHPQLTDFCRQLTQIEQYQLNNAAGFAQASQALDEWLASQTRTVLGWCSWGDYDRRQWHLQASQEHAQSSLLHLPHHNLKKHYARQQRLGRQVGLKRALQHAGLQFCGQQHRALDDARNTARLLNYCRLSGNVETGTP